MVLYLELKEMSFYSYHGVTDQEKKVGNIYNIDLKFSLKIQKFLGTDCLKDSINYVSIYKIVEKEMEIPSNLIEHVACRIIRKIKENFSLINNVEIRLSKKNPPFGGNIREVAVFIVD